jgi:hypothetical protein
MESTKDKYEIFSDILGNFESLQFFTILFIGFLIKDTNLSDLIFKDMNFRTIKNYFIKIVHYKIEDQNILNELDIIASDLETSRKRRNEVAHSGIGVEMNRDFTIDKKYIVGKDSKELTIDILHDYNNFIMKTRDKIIEISQKLRYLK